MLDIQSVVDVNELNSTRHSKVWCLMFESRHCVWLVMTWRCECRSEKIRRASLYTHASIRFQDMRSDSYVASYVDEAQTPNDYR